MDIDHSMQVSETWAKCEQENKSKRWFLDRFDNKNALLVICLIKLANWMLRQHCPSYIIKKIIQLFFHLYFSQLMWFSTIRVIMSSKIWLNSMECANFLLNTLKFRSWLVTLLIFFALNTHLQEWTLKRSTTYSYFDNKSVLFFASLLNTS